MASTRSFTAALTVLLAVGFAASPFLGPSFDGFDPNQFPVPQVNPSVQPAGYAFSIWGVIYAWLIIGMGWGLFRAREDFIWHDMRKPLCVSLLVGCFWLAIAAVGAVNGAPAPVVAAFVAGAFVISFAMHAAWALVLSSRPVRAAYAGGRRWIEAGLGTFFTFAAFKLATAER